MAFQKFLIGGPFKSGIETFLKASSNVIYNYTEGCFMQLRKDAIDISGKKYGDLTVIKPIRNGKYRGVKWLCKCVCGNEAIAFGGHLRAGKRVSCGCR
jgi:hypothetical protein